LNATPPRALAQRSRGDAAGDFPRLVALHQQSLRAFLRRLSRDHAQADDIAQEAFIIAWDRIETFDRSRDFRPFLFGIAWRKLSESRRAIFRRLTREAVALEDETVIPDMNLRLDLAAALATLPEQQRAALLLCLVHDFSHAEAAEALAIPLGTLKSLVSRGRDRLKAALGET
jgi:RNA polymerase sigma-70 factor (ECF subfamily)